MEPTYVPNSSVGTISEMQISEVGLPKSTGWVVDLEVAAVTTRSRVTKIISGIVSKLIFDVDESNYVSYDELREGFRKLRVEPPIHFSQEDYAHFIEGGLANKEGEVGSRQFEEAMRQQLLAFVQKRLTLAMRLSDDLQPMSAFYIMKILSFSLEESFKSAECDQPALTSPAETSHRNASDDAIRADSDDAIRENSSGKGNTLIAVSSVPTKISDASWDGGSCAVPSASTIICKPETSEHAFPPSVAIESSNKPSIFLDAPDSCFSARGNDMSQRAHDTWVARVESAVSSVCTALTSAQQDNEAKRAVSEMQVDFLRDSIDANTAALRTLLAAMTVHATSKDLDKFDWMTSAAEAASIVLDSASPVLKAGCGPSGTKHRKARPSNVDSRDCSLSSPLGLQSSALSPSLLETTGPNLLKPSRKSSLSARQSQAKTPISCPGLLMPTLPSSAQTAATTRDGLCTPTSSTAQAVLIRGRVLDMAASGGNAVRLSSDGKAGHVLHDTRDGTLSVPANADDDSQSGSSDFAGLAAEHPGLVNLLVQEEQPRPVSRSHSSPTPQSSSPVAAAGGGKPRCRRGGKNHFSRHKFFGHKSRTVCHGGHQWRSPSGPDEQH
mmetsp:Transcript_85470/g.227913  ORF Transcript_85470/g.227913 Transcript_85470/m.227913 type:complete len:611 (+) Transcript_85470:396-2228(+)